MERSPDDVYEKWRMTLTSDFDVACLIIQSRSTDFYSPPPSNINMSYQHIDLDNKITTHSFSVSHVYSIVTKGQRPKIRIIMKNNILFWIFLFVLVFFVNSSKQLHMFLGNFAQSGSWHPLLSYQSPFIHQEIYQNPYNNDNNYNYNDQQFDWD